MQPGTPIIYNPAMNLEEKGASNNIGNILEKRLAPSRGDGHQHLLGGKGDQRRHQHPGGDLCGDQSAENWGWGGINTLEKNLGEIDPHKLGGIKTLEKSCGEINPQKLGAHIFDFLCSATTLRLGSSA